MLEITSKIIKTDVTCVKCLQNYIFAGIGNNIHVYSIKGTLLQIYPIFEGQKIHGIIPNSTNKIAVFGENNLKLVEFDFINSKISKNLSERLCDDWIFDLQWIESDTQMTTIFAKNFISLWSASEMKHIKSIGSEERCVLYSATFVNNTWDNLFVLSGTVFGHILIWKPAESTINYAPVLYRLVGHDGAIFSIAHSAKHNTIVTTSDDRTVRLWTLNNQLTEDNCKISLKHSMYGHIARVFRCKFIKNFVVTAGEDSFVHIWDLNGKLVHKYETHQGGCVWALEYSDQEDAIITGGGDTGISLFPLILDKNIETLPVFENELPRSLKVTSVGNIVIIMDSGQLKYYKSKENIMEDIYFHKDLENYAVLEVSQCRKIVALAGLRGSIHIYKEENTLTKLCSFINSNSSRIYSLHWLSSYQFLISTVEGIMNVWSLKEVEDKYELILKEGYILPFCKERWATCAAFCFKNNLVVGDRKGNIHLFDLNNANCVQSIKKAHSHLGVTALHYFNNDLYSLGRNGILNKYAMNSKHQLLQVTNDKLPFSWLASMVNQNDVHLILGFSGSNFIIYNLNQRRIILELNCGGGHRSWNLFIKESVLYFYFIKEKKLNVYLENWLNIYSRDFVDGYHTKEINCGVFLKPDDNNLLFLSGGEDTTLRLSRFDFQIQITKFSALQVLKSHLSSIRCMLVHLLKNNEYLLFSGGGRAQIIVQKLHLNYSENKFINIECYQLDSYYKQLNDDEAETRIMDLATININKNIFLIAGSSDGTLKCFTISLEDYKLKFICDILYASKCIIHLSYIKICDRHVIISMATDGKLAFWDFTNFSDQIIVDFKPFYNIKTNQSGINSFCSKQLENETYLFASGGDDNTIALNVIDFNIVDNLIVPKFICKWDNSKTHGAQVTGIYIYNNYFISTSVDQHISVFKYKYVNNVLKCEFLKQYCSSVSDIQGMECILFQNEIYTCIYGKGLEICHVNFAYS